MNADSEPGAGKYKDLQYDFYRRRGAPLSEEEAKSLNPILNGLKQPESRYNTPVLMGTGAEKLIFKVYDRRLNRYVAMAQAASAKTERDQEQFLREGQLTANLTHPNIVPIYNMGVDSEGVPFFSMELIPGDSLRDIIQQLKERNASYESQYTLESLLGIFSKVCDAVAYAHSRNVLHLDIKPDNIRVGQFGEVLLCDWGLSRVESPPIDTGEPKPGQLDGDILNDMTLTGTMKGTPGFMAPEQVNDQKKSKQTDIYALGSILYLMLTHHLPVDGENATEVVKNTRNGSVIPPRKRKTRHAVSASLAAVTMQALAFEPTDRYTSVLHLQRDINCFLTGYPTEAEHAGIYTQMILFNQRHKKVTFWLLPFFILFSGVISLNLLVIQKEKQEAVEARLEAEKNFNLFQKKKIEADRLNMELVGVYESTSERSDNLYPAQKLEMLDRLDLQTMDQADIQKILRRKAELQFVLQQFNKAYQTLNQVNDDPEILILREVALKYGTLKSDDYTTLSHGELAELIAIKGVPGRISYAMYHHHKFEPHPIDTPEAFLPLASILLGKVNGISGHSIKPLTLIKREEGYYLDLSGTRYSTYTFPVFGNYSHEIFSPLHLYGLDISQTPVSLLKELSGLRIKELRMVHVKLESKYNIFSTFKLMGLERVTLGKGDYPAHLIRSLREGGIEVIEEE